MAADSNLRSLLTRPDTAPNIVEATEAGDRAQKFSDVKQRIHQKLIEKLDMTQLNTLDGDRLRREVRVVVEHLCNSEDSLLNRSERDRLIEEVLDETFGYGPLEVLLKDMTITDIFVNGAKDVYIEKSGQIQKTEVCFRDDRHLRQIIDRIVSRVGRRVDEVSPMVDARLPDGSRVNAIIPPLAIDGPSVSIRRFGSKPLTSGDLLGNRALSEEMLEMLQACVKARLNIVISGGTGSGKTTLLNCLSSYVPRDDRIVTIEDAAELQLQQDHVVRLETRPPNIEGRGAVTQRDLVINSLRMRPDRIIVGEVRGAEALDMIQAMNTGHEGSMTTIHANTPRDALSRLETMISMAGLELPVKAMRQQFASAIDVIVQVNRLTGGPRRITSVSEVLNMEQDTVVMQDIFAFQQMGLNEEGKAFGRFMATGVRPQFMERLQAAGVQLPVDMFRARALGEA